MNTQRQALPALKHSPQEDRSKYVLTLESFKESAVPC